MITGSILEPNTAMHSIKAASSFKFHGSKLKAQSLKLKAQKFKAQKFKAQKFKV
jgi:hypothetical protein